MGKRQGATWKVFFRISGTDFDLNIVEKNFKLSPNFPYWGTNQFDIFCTSTLYSVRFTFWLAYFELFYPASVVQKSSTHRIYSDPNFSSVFLTKLYIDQNCISTCNSRPIRSPDLQKSRSTEKVELMRTQILRCTQCCPPFNQTNIFCLFSCCFSLKCQ